MDKAHTVKRIVCLANSRKLNGSCIAGKELLPDGTTGSWIRPVSARGHEEVSLSECRCTDNSIPQVLDVIEVPVVSPKPRDYQQENWLLDRERRWIKRHSISTGELSAMSDPTNTLWTNNHSTYHGLNDRVPEVDANDFRNSLYLIRVDSLQLRVFAPGADFGNDKKRVQGRFPYNGTEYSLRVTDHDYEYEYVQQPVGLYAIGQCFLTISLGEPYEGYAYKLIAAVIEL